MFASVCACLFLCFGHAAVSASMCVSVCECVKHGQISQLLQREVVNLRHCIMGLVQKLGKCSTQM